MIEIKTVNLIDKQLLDGLRNADNSSIEKIYDLALPSVMTWVKENNGHEADARDIFQDALISLFRRLETKDLILTCTLKSYLRIMCRNLWLSRLRNRKKIAGNTLEDIESVELDSDLINKLEHAEKEQLFFKHFDLLGEKCRKILQWHFDKVPVKKIAEKLDTSEGYIKKRKFLCKEKLVKQIQEDHIYRELIV